MIKVDNVDAMVWCRNGNFSPQATPCEEVKCPHKKNRDEVLPGIIQCGTFQITTPAFDWGTAHHLSNDLSTVREVGT